MEDATRVLDIRTYTYYIENSGVHYYEGLYVRIEFLAEVSINITEPIATSSKNVLLKPVAVLPLIIVPRAPATMDYACRTSREKLVKARFPSRAARYIREIAARQQYLNDMTDADFNDL